MTITSKSTPEEISAELRWHNALTEQINLIIINIKEELGGANGFWILSPDKVKTVNKGELTAWIFRDSCWLRKYFGLTEAGYIIMPAAKIPKGVTRANVWVEKLTEIKNLDERMVSESYKVIDSKYLYFMYTELVKFLGDLICPPAGD